MTNEDSLQAAALDHLNIVVADLDRSVEFYARVLGMQKGFEALLEGPWIDEVTGLHEVSARCVFMSSGTIPVRLEILQYLQPTGQALDANSLPHLPGVRHFAFRVPDLDAFYVRSLALGVPFVSPPVVVPFPLPGGQRKRLCYFYDPDGVLLEAAEYREG